MVENGNHDCCQLLPIGEDCDGFRFALPILRD